MGYKFFSKPFANQLRLPSAKVRPTPPPPPLQLLKRFNTPRGRVLARGGPRALYFPTGDAAADGSRGGGGAVGALCTLCERVGYFGPVSPDGQGDGNNDCVPIHRTAQILNHSKNSGKAMLKMPDCCLNLLFLPLWMDAFLVVGGLQDGEA